MYVLSVYSVQSRTIVTADCDPVAQYPRSPSAHARYYRANDKVKLSTNLQREFGNGDSVGKPF
jgi:hypothetical protein